MFVRRNFGKWMDGVNSLALSSWNPSPLRVRTSFPRWELLFGEANQEILILSGTAVKEKDSEF